MTRDGSLSFAEKAVASRGRLREGSKYGDIGSATKRSYLHQHVAELKDILSQMDETEFIVAGIRYKIRRNLIQNFQVPRLSDLRGEEDAPSMVNVENFGEFVIAAITSFMATTTPSS